MKPSTALKLGKDGTTARCGICGRKVGTFKPFDSAALGWPDDPPIVTVLDLLPGYHHATEPYERYELVKHAADRVDRDLRMANQHGNEYGLQPRNARARLANDKSVTFSHRRERVPGQSDRWTMVGNWAPIRVGRHLFATKSHGAGLVPRFIHQGETLAPVRCIDRTCGAVNAVDVTKLLR